MLSYYDIYMAANPNDKLEILIPQLIKNFANDIKNFNFLDFIENDKINQDKLDVALYVLKCHYQWYKIKADVYKHIITRSTLIALNKRHDIYKCISRRVLENCLDIICHNINIIEANNILRRVLLSYNNIHIQLKKRNININFDELINRYFQFDIADEKIKKKLIFEVYAAWASFGRGTHEKNVCDSDNAPHMIKKLLNICSYNADDMTFVATINRIIDIVHCRNDLSNAFVEGGSKTCLMVSNLKI